MTPLPGRRLDRRLEPGDDRVDPLPGQDLGLRVGKPFSPAPRSAFSKRFDQALGAFPESVILPPGIKNHVKVVHDLVEARPGGNGLAHVMEERAYFLQGRRPQVCLLAHGCLLETVAAFDLENHIVPLA
jgi:hypothetical protein